MEKRSRENTKKAYTKLIKQPLECDESCGAVLSDQRIAALFNTAL